MGISRQFQTVILLTGSILPPPTVFVVSGKGLTVPTLWRSTAIFSVRDSMRKILLKSICCLNIMLLNDSMTVAEVI